MSKILCCTLMILFGLSFVNSAGMDMGAMMNMIKSAFEGGPGGAFKEGMKKICSVMQMMFQSASGVKKMFEQFMGNESNGSSMMNQFFEKCKNEGVLM